MTLPKVEKPVLGTLLVALGMVGGFAVWSITTTVNATASYQQSIDATKDLSRETHQLVDSLRRDQEAIASRTEAALKAAESRRDAESAVLRGQIDGVRSRVDTLLDRSGGRHGELLLPNLDNPG